MNSNQIITLLLVSGGLIISPFVILVAAKVAGFGWHLGKDKAEKFNHNHKEHRDNGTKQK